MMNVLFSNDNAFYIQLALKFSLMLVYELDYGFFFFFLIKKKMVFSTKLSSHEYKLPLADSSVHIYTIWYPILLE